MGGGVVVLSSRLNWQTAFLAALLAASIGTLPATLTAGAAEVFSSGHSCRNKTGAGGKFRRDYFIYFESASSALSDDDLDEIDRVRRFAEGQKAYQICLFGKASKKGDARSNAALARARSEAVAQVLVDLGWPAARIAIEPEGEAWGWLQEALTSDAAEDRRVRIRLSQ